MKKFDLLTSWKIAFNLEKARDKPWNLECLPKLLSKEEIFLAFIRGNDLDTVIIGREWAQLAILWHWQIISNRDNHYFFKFLTFFFSFSSFSSMNSYISFCLFTFFIYTSATWWRTLEVSMKTNRSGRKKRGRAEAASKRLEFELKISSNFCQEDKLEFLW